MSSTLDAVFVRLRDILATRSREFTISSDSAQHYCLNAPVGDATLKQWGGKIKTPTIPVAWVEVQQAYVSFHLMGIMGNTKLVNSLSSALRARMHGKSCFNFKAIDEMQIAELDRVTGESLRAMKTMGYIAD